MASKTPYVVLLDPGLFVLMLAISIGLVLSMLFAKSSVDTKIKEVKASSGTTITISSAGIMRLLVVAH